jgi:hypothetical protein
MSESRCDSSSRCKWMGRPGLYLMVIFIMLQVLWLEEKLEQLCGG